MKAAQAWRFTQERKVEDIQVTAPLSADQGDTLVGFAVSGAGIVRMPEWVMADHLSEGRLVRLLPDWTPPSIPLHIVYARGAATPLRTRLLVDFIRRSVRSSGVLPK